MRRERIAMRHSLVDGFIAILLCGALHGCAAPADSSVVASDEPNPGAATATPTTSTVSLAGVATLVVPGEFTEKTTRGFDSSHTELVSADLRIFFEFSRYASRLDDAGRDKLDFRFEPRTIPFCGEKDGVTGRFASWRSRSRPSLPGRAVGVAVGGWIYGSRLVVTITPQTLAGAAIAEPVLWSLCLKRKRDEVPARAQPAER